MWDEEIDDALAHYAAAERRAGLEDRVLARVRIRRRHRSGVWAALAASVVAGGLLNWRSPVETFSMPKPAGPPAVPVIQAVTARSAAVTKASTRAPKLAKFPRSSPLTEQERLLLAVATHPQLAEDASETLSEALRPLHITPIEIAELETAKESE